MSISLYLSDKDSDSNDDEGNNTKDKKGLAADAEIGKKKK
jgi:hypothetical protein